MTNAEINRRIAEMCGWKPAPKHADKWWEMRHGMGDHPDYCTDLNAGVKACRVLGYDYFIEMAAGVCRARCKPSGPLTHWPISSERDAVPASALARAIVAAGGE